MTMTKTHLPNDHGRPSCGMTTRISRLALSYMPTCKLCRNIQLGLCEPADPAATLDRYTRVAAAKAAPESRVR